ncbi:hypothetical protein ECANGB1_2066 [Enterospora canceri]|uniref:Uncharacterized protein n=1 Tax=Enterospora canceri TaxID=1081671 RepID=A0A1Y1S8S4_9MICR|nr:hypothetical protein ECANGB1_2066 [Enterospora canceri]
MESILFKWYSVYKRVFIEGNVTFHNVAQVVAWSLVICMVIYLICLILYTLMQVVLIYLNLRQIEKNKERKIGKMGIGDRFTDSKLQLEIDSNVL